MKIRKKWLHALGAVNFAVLGAGIINALTGAVPSLQENTTILTIQAVIAALAPSLGGIANKVSTTEEEKP